MLSPASDRDDRYSDEDFERYKEIELRNCARVSQQWLKRGDDVYMREKFDGKDWSGWRLTPMREVPYIILERFEQ